MKIISILILAILSACITREELVEQKSEPDLKKTVIYQMFPRLFGNTNTTNKPWGTIEENGVGKFHDITETALKEIKELGVTHIWYTGVLHHAVIRDYTVFGIGNDDPDIVKGRAGSPYAIKDYYNVDPDLAIDPDQRLEEFESLIFRTHEAGLKVIIDIVPNHVARNYEGLNNPPGIEDLGAKDDRSKTYAVNNNFYYNPGEAFQPPIWENGILPLGGDVHPLSDGKYQEVPAKWTGNGSRASQPSFHDWYETVKVNYGESPDGVKDFERLPEGFGQLGHSEHFAFWKGKTVPDSWLKFRDIALFWIEKGIDGFRYDMAEMVPVEFWSFMNSSIKNRKPDAFLLAEVYNPSLYRDYIHLGKMDYLYDKVQLYDTLKSVIQGHGSTEHISSIQNYLYDIEHHMLHFLENHDEQRIASPEFAGSAEKGKPAMVVSALLSSSPTMIYFGQEVGEPGAEYAGFGHPSRTSIFDYIGVPHHQRWMNNGQFDGGQLSRAENELRDFYKRLLNFSISNEALSGAYLDLHQHNIGTTEGYDHQVYSFLRWKNKERLVIISNFNDTHAYDFQLRIPKEVCETLKLEEGIYSLTDQLYGKETSKLNVNEDQGFIKIHLEPLASLVYRLD